MRILLYVEPHPIRDSHKMFAAVARDFFPLLKQSTADFDVRMFMTRSLRNVFRSDELEQIKNRLIEPLPEEENLFASHMRDWETEGIADWVDLMEGGTTADPYIALLSRVWGLFPFDVIVHWGENGAVTRFINDRSVTRIAMELGCTRAPFAETLVMDPFGTNGASLPPRLDVKDLEKIVHGRGMSSSEALMCYSAEMEVHGYEGQFEKPVDEALLSRLASSNRPVAFLPLQLHDDANLLRFSKYSTVTDVVLDSVPRLVEAGYLVVIKTHPAAKARRNSQTAFSLAQGALGPWSDHVVWIDATKTNMGNARMFSLADLIVTVNSSVGFEALYFDRPVCLLGESAYSPAGVFPSLDEVLTGDVDRDSYLKSVGLLRRFMLGGYLVPTTILKSRSEFENVVRVIDSASRRHSDDAASIATAVYRALAPQNQSRAHSRMIMGRSAPGAGDRQAAATAPQPSKSKDEKSSVMDHRGKVMATAVRRVVAALQSTTLDEFESVIRKKFSDLEEREALIRHSGLVDPVFYLRTHGDVARAGREPIEHWSRSGINERRLVRAGLSFASAESFADEIVDYAARVFDGELSEDFPLESVESNSRSESLAVIKSRLAQSRRRLCVVAHMYYANLVPEMLTYLSNIPEEFDLIVTLPNWGNEGIIEGVMSWKPDALFYASASRGRDIGPFVDLLPMLIEHKYDAVLHLQTKAEYSVDGRQRSELGRVWREETFESLLGSLDRVDSILQLLRSDSTVSAIGPAPYFVSLEDYPYHDSGALAAGYLGSEPGYGFFAGTMFWAKPQTFESIIGLGGLSLTSFGPETGDNDGALPPLVERLFGHCMTANGMRVVGAPVVSAEDLLDPLTPATSSIHDHVVDSYRALLEEKAVSSSRLRS